MKNSQVYTLLESFKKGDLMTANSAFQKHGIATFSQRIKDIERMGYTIGRHWVSSPQGKKFMQYWLVQEKVAA